MYTAASISGSTTYCHSVKSKTRYQPGRNFMSAVTSRFKVTALFVVWYSVNLNIQIIDAAVFEKQAEIPVQGWISPYFSILALRVGLVISRMREASTLFHFTSLRIRPI